MAWIDTMEALADLADSLTVDEWRRPTDLPGWDVKDNISHVAGLEAVILGWPQPHHELPDGLAHVRDIFIFVIFRGDKILKKTR